MKNENYIKKLLDVVCSKDFQYFKKCLQHKSDNELNSELVVNSFMNIVKLFSRELHYKIIQDGIIDNNLGMVKIRDHNQEFVFSKFRGPYSQNLDFEFFIYKVFDNEDLIGHYPSNAFPVWVNYSSVEDQRLMALFPENWHFYHNRHGHIKTPKVYYFLDKFFIRFKQQTLEILTHFTSGSSFFLLKNISNQNLINASMNWVSLHEHFHSHSALPLPESLPHKNSKLAGAFEELKVDTCSMLEARKLPCSSPSFREILSEYVLSERLLLYNSVYSLSSDYDAMAGQFFFNKLLEYGGISLNEHQDGLILSRNIWPAIEKIGTELFDTEIYAASFRQPQVSRKIFRLVMEGGLGKKEQREKAEFFKKTSAFVKKEKKAS